MRESVARNDIIGLKWIYYGTKRYILYYWGTLIYIFNSIISYQWIKVYRVERIYVVKISLTHWHPCNIQMQPSQ